MTRRHNDHSPALLAYTGVQIVGGIVAFLWCALSFPISETISLTSTGGREGILLGLVFWILIGLLGGTRVERLHGHGVLTFHIPFIIAAMALGGPTAGAIVAMISTIEARELREAPWYGVLANHAALTLAAIAGGVVLLGVRDVLSTGIIGVDPEAVELVAIILGALTLTLTATALVAGTVILRDHLTFPEAVNVFDTSYRVTAANEVVLGWLLAVTYASIGWWAALVCATLVLLVWRGLEAMERSDRDPLSGLLTRAPFNKVLATAIQALDRRGQSFALLAIDLDGFKVVNDTMGHAAGDDVIRAVGLRLRGAIRLTDAGGRLGGDEFAVVLTDLPGLEAAHASATRIYERICAPIDTDAGPVPIGASIGLYFQAPGERAPTMDVLYRKADTLMYQAKRAHGGIRTGPTEIAPKDLSPAGEPSEPPVGEPPERAAEAPTERSADAATDRTIDSGPDVGPDVPPALAS